MPLRRGVLNPYSNQFSTSSRLRAGIAAPEIKFDRSEGEGGDQKREEMFYARLVPDSPSYFTAQPGFIDEFLVLQNTLRKHVALPVVKPADAPRVAFRSLAQYRNACGETVKASKYHLVIKILKRLNQIHPSIRPAEVTEMLNKYKKDFDPFSNRPPPPGVDAAGKGLGHGRRKTSTAQAWLIEGTGEVLINGKTLAEAFGRIHDRESAIWPLKATDRIDKYNVWAKVTGGGTTGQAEALTLAVAKALLVHEPALKPALRRGKP